MSDQQPELKSAIIEVLEAVRGEAVRRMVEAGLALSVPVSQLREIENSDGSGASSEWLEVRVSGLRSHDAQMAIRDETVPHQLLGFRDQLGDLATRLANETDLGAKRENGQWPGLTGADAVLVRYLCPLSLHYLLELADLAVPDEALAGRLAGELESLAYEDVLWHSKQISLSGLRPMDEFEHRNVKLRPLTDLERGAIWQRDLQDQTQRQWLTGDYIMPQRIHVPRLPDSLLEVLTSRPKGQPQGEVQLIYSMILAFFLWDFTIYGYGSVTTIDIPRWATFGTIHSPIALQRSPSGRKDIDFETFKAIVDLAYKMPGFARNESSPREIALDRVLKGCGATNDASGFLDFVIALEAALLDGVETELSYRSSLYGALFLRGALPPEETFQNLRNIYRVRSKIVHGSPISGPKREAAIKDAAELSKMVIRLAVERGWPKPSELDATALQSGPVDVLREGGTG